MPRRANPFQNLSAAIMTVFYEPEYAVEAALTDLSIQLEVKRRLGQSHQSDAIKLGIEALKRYDKEVKNMEKWRKSILRRLDTTLILFELVLSVVFFTVGHLIGSGYIRGVGVGLIIAWVTSALAYLYRKKKVAP